MARTNRNIRQSPRDRLVDTALSLFAQRGFHATGIDTILEEAGVAKMTLYKHFSSKDDLILATIERQGAQFREWLTQRVEKLARSPRDRLLAVFSAIGEWCADPDYAGCVFTNATAEFHRTDDPIHQAAFRQKKWVHDFVRDLSSAAGARDPISLACQLCVLLDGAFVATHVSGKMDPIPQAAAAAQILVDGALAPAKKSSRRLRSRPKPARIKKRRGRR